MKKINFKSKKSIITIVSVLVALLIIVAVVMYSKKKKTASDNDELNSNVDNTSEINTSAIVSQGSTGTLVRVVQQYLKKLGENIGTTGDNGDGVDGSFGVLTAAAVKNVFGHDYISETDMSIINETVD